MGAKRSRRAVLVALATMMMTMFAATSGTAGPQPAAGTLGAGSPGFVAAWNVGAPGVVLAGCKGCGCRGGPGYRAPNGKCVGQRDLLRICGNPPTTRCKKEN